MSDDRLAIRLLQKLVDVIDALPVGLRVDDIAVIGSNPVAGGGFSDVWQGGFQNETVSLKVLRSFDFFKPENTSVRKVCVWYSMTDIAAENVNRSASRKF